MNDPNDNALDDREMLEKLRKRLYESTADPIYRMVDTRQLLSAANDLNEAVIAYRDEMENSSPYEAPYSHIDKMAELAEKLAALVVEQVNQEVVQ